MSGQARAEYPTQLGLAAVGGGPLRWRLGRAGGCRRRGEAQHGDTLTATGTWLEYPLLVVGQVSSKEGAGRFAGFNYGGRDRRH